MPILDSTLLLSDAQAVTATAASTNVIDLGTTGTPPYSSVALVRDLGKSIVPLVAQVNTTFTGLTSLALAIQTSADNSTYTDVYNSGAIALATLKSGYQFSIDEIPLGSLKRYIRAYYTVVGTGTAGTVTVAIATGIQTNVNGG